MKINNYIKTLKKSISFQGNKNCLLAIINAAVQNPFEEAFKADVLVYEGKIIAINEIEEKLDVEEVFVVDAEGKYLTSGLVDEHLHGGFGVDFNSASKEEVSKFAKKVNKRGITGFLPTIMTDDEGLMKKQIEVISSVEDKSLIGIHLEGPFLSPNKKGIHPSEHIKLPTIENFKKFENDKIKILTFAVEEDEKFELVKYLISKKIIPSVGHSGANYEQGKIIFENGVCLVTHIFNAMNPIHHREPNLITEAILNDDIYTEIIADTEHIHKKVLEMFFKLKNKEKIILISDALPLTSSSLDKIIFGGEEIFNNSGKAQSKDGTFAGSTMFLDDIGRILLKENLVSFSDFIGFASLNPIKNLGLQNLGKIEKNYTANIILWDKDFNVTDCFIEGEKV